MKIYDLAAIIAKSAERNRFHGDDDWKSMLERAASEHEFALPDDPQVIKDTVEMYLPAAYRRVLAAEILAEQETRNVPPEGWIPVIQSFASRHGINLDNYGRMRQIVYAITATRQKWNDSNTPERGADVMSGPARIHGGQRRRIIDPRGL